MNLNEDFINVQGILLSVEKTAGPLAKVRHRGGHESTILNLSSELLKFLSSKSYIKNQQINDAFDEQLKEICLFLILNTEFKEPLNEPGFEHLINITPQLSTCLLANVIVGLDLSKHFCNALHRFDSNVIQQILLEIVPCIKKCKLKIHVVNAYEYLKLIITKIMVANDSSAVESFTDIASQMLLNLTGLHGHQIENARIDSVYVCMGYTLLNLLDLLLLCNEKNKNLEKIIEKLIKTCCSIMMAVTLDVYCSWAEVEHEDEILQMIIASKSYIFIEKYQKNTHAKELITMLGTIAKKPKTINEQIYSADKATMVAMVNKADSNQKQWFTALLNTQVLDCKDSIDCVDRWAFLCTVSDVTRLLNLSIYKKNTDVRNVVVKCAATLDFNELVLVTTRHFFQNGITHNLNDNVQPQLILIFNKIKDKNIGNEFCKELYLLLLQNPKQTLSYIFSECSKNAFYSCNLAPFWPSIKEIITIDNFGMSALENEMSNNKLCEQNCRNYIQLCNALAGPVVTAGKIVTDVILPLLQDSVNEENFTLTTFGLEILKDLHGDIVLEDKTENLFNFLLELMKSCRCNFSTFDGLNQEVVKLTVDVVDKYSKMNRSVVYSSGQGLKSEDLFITFYKEKLFGPNSDINPLTHFFQISFEKHAEIVAHLIKVLAVCVTPEWVMLSTNLLNFCGTEKTSELLCDSMILICEVVKSQDTETEEVKRMFNALRYYLQNLGIVIKDCLQPKVNSLKEDVTLTKNVCRLLKEVPSGSLKSEEGLSLASLLSDVSLKALRPDKKFACLIASINEPHICRMLATKILS
ncbi:uncharacterized protein LOC135126890 [Zophobas morio]|uniref:uncharacterized protein LOC135126890 n=1 Tax=Zophobas morio TaxID=2755281 RepID=UPI0030833A62